MSSPIESLPVELFDLCADYLDSSAIKTLRLTSNELYCRVLPIFAKEHFSKLTVILGATALDRLLLLADRRHLAHAVAQVDIRLLNFGDYQLMTKIHQIGIYPPPKRFRSLDCIKLEDYGAESTFYSLITRNETTHFVQRLARALKAFRNLKVVCLYAQKPEPFEWQSNPVPRQDQAFRSQCFRVVLDALVLSGVQLNQLNLGKLRKSTSLTDCAHLPYIAIQLSEQRLLEVRRCLSSLDTLTLSVVAAHDSSARPPGWANDLSRVISLVPVLECLFVSLDRKDQVSRYSADVLHCLSLSTRLTKLKVLHIYNTTAHEEDLVKFVKEHSLSLQKLALVQVDLISGAWSGLFAILHSVQDLQWLKLVCLSCSSTRIRFCNRHTNRKSHSLTLKTGGNWDGRRTVAEKLETLGL